MFKSFPRTSVLVGAGTLALMTGCSVGPDYVEPANPQPGQYSESGPWKKPTRKTTFRGATGTRFSTIRS